MSLLQFFRSLLADAISRISALALFAVLVVPIPLAESQAADLEPMGFAKDQDLFVFGGVMTEGDFPGSAMVPLASELEDNPIVGAAYNLEFAELGAGFRLGGEAGLAARFGSGTSAEFWLGPSLRFDGIQVGSANISFGIVAGMSFVTDTVGIEKIRETEAGGDATALYYMGPEVAISFDGLPDTEFLFRAHHRSGGENVSFLPSINGIGDASNANLFGIRRNF